MRLVEFYHTNHVKDVATDMHSLVRAQGMHMYGQYRAFQQVSRGRALTSFRHRFWQGFRHDAHPMAMMVGVVGSLAAFCECPHTLAIPQLSSFSGAVNADRIEH